MLSKRTLRRGIPIFALVALTCGAGWAAATSIASQPRFFRAPAPIAGMQNATHVPWVSVGIGWGVGLYSPVSNEYSVHGEARYRNIDRDYHLTLASPKGQLFDLGPLPLTNLLEWSHNGRYLLATTRHAVVRIDIQSMAVRTVFAFPSRYGRSQDEIDVARFVHFFTSDGSAVVVTSRQGGWKNSAGRVVPLDGGRPYNLHGLGCTWDVAKYAKDGRSVACPARGVRVTDLSRGETETLVAPQHENCNPIKWESSSTILAQCVISAEYNTRLYSFDTARNTATPVTPIPGFLTASGGIEYGFSGRWIAAGNSYVHWDATCGPGGLERVVGDRTTTKGIPPSVAYGTTLGQAGDSIYNQQPNSECFGEWTVSRWTPPATTARTVLKTTAWPGTFSTYFWLLD